MQLLLLHWHLVIFLKKFTVNEAHNSYSILVQDLMSTNWYAIEYVQHSH